MNEAEERAYLRGQRSTWDDVMRTAMGKIGRTRTAAWTVERADVVRALRSLCIELEVACEWEDDTHLGDTIDRIAQALSHRFPSKTVDLG